MNSVVKVTDRTRNDLKCVDGPLTGIKPNQTSKTTGRIFKTWSECFPQCLVVRVLKRIPVRRQTWCRRPSLIFLVIASPQKLQDGFE